MRPQITSELRAATAAILVGFVLLCALRAESADCTPIGIAVQPQSLGVGEGCPATFVISVTGSGPYRYQWWRDDQPIPDGTNSTYTIATPRTSDNGTRVRVTISNDCSNITSAEGLLYILLDVVPPRLLRAHSDATLERIIASFAVGACGWPGLDTVTAQEVLNYSCSGGITTSNALLDASGTNVILTTSRQTPGAIYTLTASAVADLHGNTIPSNSEAKFQAWVIMPGSDPGRIVPPPVAISRSNNTFLVLQPLGGLLEQAERITGPWSLLGDAGHPYWATDTNGARFFRAVFSP